MASSNQEADQHQAIYDNICGKCHLDHLSGWTMYLTDLCPQCIDLPEKLSQSPTLAQSTVDQDLR